VVRWRRARIRGPQRASSGHTPQHKCRAPSASGLISVWPGAGLTVRYRAGAAGIFRERSAGIQPCRSAGSARGRPHGHGAVEVIGLSRGSADSSCEAVGQGARPVVRGQHPRLVIESGSGHPTRPQSAAQFELPWLPRTLCRSVNISAKAGPLHDGCLGAFAPIVVWDS